MGATSPRQRQLSTVNRCEGEALPSVSI